MGTVRMLSKGQIVIPAGLRKKFRIGPGTEMQIMEYGGIIYLIALLNLMVTVGSCNI